MFGHVDIGSQMAGDDGVEEDEDTERQPEEQADDGEEECFCPWWINICATFCFGPLYLLKVVMERIKHTYLS